VLYRASALIDWSLLYIVLNILTPSSNFFYNNYSIKHFITLNRLILIKTAKNIVISINNNAFTYGLTSSIGPSSIEPANIENLTININFLNYYFNNNR
jgi:hypothetical protein